MCSHVMSAAVRASSPAPAAEECGMLDYLTSGRLEIGAGGNPRETTAVVSGPGPSAGLPGDLR